MMTLNFNLHLFSLDIFRKNLWNFAVMWNRLGIYLEIYFLNLFPVAQFTGNLVNHLSNIVFSVLIENIYNFLLLFLLLNSLSMVWKSNFILECQDFWDWTGSKTTDSCSKCFGIPKMKLDFRNINWEFTLIKIS